MDIQTPEKAFEKAVRRAAVAAVGIEPDTIPLTYPPTASLGDIASPVCFELARTARKPPRAIAEAIVAAFVPEGGIARVEAAGGGYINAFLDRRLFLSRSLQAGKQEIPAVDTPKVIVEHTNINPNKAAHIGHLRNAVLGDTLVRFLRRLGNRVEVQNYIDDTGVQVADLVVGFRVLRNESVEDVREKYAEDKLSGRGERFDYIAWDLYAEVTRFYEENRDRLSHRADTIHAMEEGGNPVSELAAEVSRRMVRHHLRTMKRIGVHYDVLPRESDILALNFWDKAFSRLRETGAIHKIEDGKNAGCWVMDMEGAETGVGEDQKVIVRSNGTVTYVGKDIAYQMWKFGLLGRDFRYVPFEWESGEGSPTVWSTTSGTDSEWHPAFGAGETVYNVIDIRQSYLQRVVAQGLRTLGHVAEADRSIHFAYEMVALTPSAVRAMFPDHHLSEEELGKPYLEMSGRKGLGVRADDLVDTLIARAEKEVRQRNPDQSDEIIRRTAHMIAVGALRYYMLRFTRNRVVAFDLDAALAFEGETGPYLQYSVVRARNILAKLSGLFGEDSTNAAALAGNLDLDLLPEDSASEHWNLALLLIRVPAMLRQAVDSLELAIVAKHAYVLAQTFNTFYHRYQVVREEDERIRMTRTAIVRLFHDGMIDLLGLMGIEVPDRM